MPRARFKLKKVKGDKEVTEDSIPFELAKAVQMSVEQIAETETSNLANLEKNLKAEVYGQDECIDAITDKIHVLQAGLKEENKPVGSFVFMGPNWCW